MSASSDSNEEILKELAAMRAHFELRFDQVKAEVSLMKTEMKIEASQLKAEMKAEMKTEMGLLKMVMNRRMDHLAGRVVELGGQMQQPIEDGGQVKRERVDEAINNAGDEAQTGQENEDDDQDSVSVKSEIDSDSCQSEFDYEMNEDIVVKKEEVAVDSGIGGQHHQDQAPIEPVAGPSGTSRTAPKRSQVNQASSQHRLNLCESNGTNDSDETNSPSTKQARTTTTASKGRKRRPCPHCSKMVTNLTTHARTHTGERPYVCQYTNCGRAFTQKGSLDEHLRRHRGERSHHCGQCGKLFYSTSDVAKHRRRMH